MRPAGSRAQLRGDRRPERRRPARCQRCPRVPNRMSLQASALVLVAPRQLEERTLPVPDPGPGEAILAVEACGLCGTDHEVFAGVMPARLPLVPGHEIVGVVADASPEFLAARKL